TVAFEHQMAVMSFTFISAQRPDHLIFDNGSVSYTVTYSSITPNTIEGDDYYTSHIMIEPCEAAERTLTFSLYDSDNNAYDIREATTSKAYLAGVRYTAPVSELEPTVWLGSGTSGDPYQITTADQLRQLSTNVKNGVSIYSDTYFIMTNDIALGGSANPFTPIGTNSYRFGGIFDGGGYEVSGLYYNDDEQYLGLFGYVSGATIRNVGVSGTISGYNNIGGIVGYAIGVTIENCYNEASLSSDGGSIGGILGSTSSSASSVVINCYNLGEITDNSTSSYACVGGVVGYSDGGTTVTNSYNGGTVTSGGQRVGGIVGFGNSGAITLCYNSGSVSGGVSNVGSILGSTSSSATIVTNCYYLDSDSYAGADNKITDDYMKGASFVADLNDLAYDYNNLSTTTTKACAWVQQTDDYPTLDLTAEPIPVYELEYDATSGTYLIHNGNGLKAFADLVNGNENTCDAKVSLNEGDAFESAAKSISGTLTDDIDLSGVCNSSDAVNWEPIGVLFDDKPYSGKFDGGSFTVSGLYIDSSTANFQGLFGYTSGATISNLTVSGEVSGGDAVGGIVGNADESTKISNCHNSANVGGSEGVGGIVGTATYYSTISSCTNAGVVTGADYIGGIAGKSAFSITDCSNSSENVTGTGTSTGGIVGENTGTISYCYNQGAVDCTSSCGGVAGSNSGSISDCYNNSTVSGGSSGYATGGVVGYNIGTVTSSYNTSTISGHQNVGGVVGGNHDVSIIINCYNNGAVDGYDISGGVVGQNWEDATIVNCYNTGVVGTANYSYRSGGVVGENYGAVTNCYNSAEALGESLIGGVVGNNLGGTFTYCYYNTDATSSDNGGATGMVSAAMQYPTFIETLNSGAYLYNQSLTAENAIKAYAWKSGTDYPLLDPPNYPSEGHYDMQYDSYTETYQINTALGLKAFADLVNGNTNTYGAFIENLDDSFGTMNSSINGELTSDINLSGVCGSTIGDWEPIGNVTIDDDGTISSSFKGEFDGKGYTISNIYINSDTKSYQGLFGVTTSSAAKVSNITITGEITAYCYIGGISGMNYNGATITSCHNKASLYGYGDSNTYIGGITGCNYTSNSSNSRSSITQCSNTAEVEGSEGYVGGIAGQNYASDISECYNTGDITSTKGYVGGIAGATSGKTTAIHTVKNCYNTGDIYGLMYVGGVVGCASNATLVSCYSAAKKITFTITTGQILYGGFVGLSIDSNYTDCYYDSSVSFYSPSGITDTAIETDLAKDATTMIGGSFAATLNGESGTSWKEDTGINSGYPILTWQNAE
ncbi:MAG: GLUG motif-containing protein, partial [Rikenellaceae bacterium]